MISNFFGKCKDILIEATQKLSGNERRSILAMIAMTYGYGGETFVAKTMCVGRDTIRKGIHEAKTGIKCKDAFNMRGRKKITEKMPSLEKDLRNIIDSQSQIDPKFQSERLYTRLTISEIRIQLVKKGYNDSELPTNQTLNTLVNRIGYTLKKVKKTEPQDKIAETDAIFQNLKKVHEKTQDDDTVVRLSIDTKDRVKIGNFSRRGKSRVKVNAADHDFGGEFTTPFGILDIKTGTIDLSITESKVTADFMVDCIEEYWNANYLSTDKKTLIINADNGPENSSRRTQFIKRLVEFAAKRDITIVLAYYPPYHSKYNPIERVWGALEQHWNGSLLDSKDTVVKFAKSMKYNKQHPQVKVISKVYETGIKLTPEVMSLYDLALERMAGIAKWFVTIEPVKCRRILDTYQLN